MSLATPFQERHSTGMVCVGSKFCDGQLLVLRILWHWASETKMNASSMEFFDRLLIPVSVMLGMLLLGTEGHVVLQPTSLAMHASFASPLRDPVYQLV